MRASVTLPLLLLLATIFGASLTGISQKSDSLKPADAQTIITMMFELEFKERESTGEILISPRLKKEWIPTNGDFKFRQLAYSEEKNVAEYYEISLQSQSGVVLASLNKGDACVKAGRRYSFEKRGAEWVAKEVGSIRSHSPGITCPGCVVGSGRRYTVEEWRPNTNQRQPGLRLNAKITDLSCSRVANYVSCEIGLNLDFSNTSQLPVIFMKPFEENPEGSYTHCATYVAYTRTAASQDEFIDSSYFGSNYSGLQKYKVMANEIDQAEPSEKLFRTLKPGEVVAWKRKIQYTVSQENACDSVIGSTIGTEIGWREIKKLNQPLWMRVSFELWPVDIERYKQNLGMRLNYKWEKFGSLWADELVSEPFELDFSKQNP